jgi:hypothetical protein
MNTPVGLSLAQNTLLTQRLGNLELTQPERLAEAVFRQKLQVLDLLVERIATSGNPRFVVQYLALLQEVEAIVAAILEHTGAANSPYLAPPQQPTPAATSGKPSNPAKGATKPTTGRETRPTVAKPEPTTTPQPVQGFKLPPLSAEPLVAGAGAEPASGLVSAAVRTTPLPTPPSGSEFSPYLRLVEPLALVTNPLAHWRGSGMSKVNESR